MKMSCAEWKSIKVSLGTQSVANSDTLKVGCWPCFLCYIRAFLVDIEF